MPDSGQNTLAQTEIEIFDHDLDQLSAKAKKYLILSTVFGIFTVIVSTIESILVFTLPGWPKWLDALINFIPTVFTAAAAWCMGYAFCLCRIPVRCR